MITSRLSELRERRAAHLAFAHDLFNRLLRAECSTTNHVLPGQAARLPLTMTHPYTLQSSNSLEYVLEPLAFKRGCDVKTDPWGYSSSYIAGGAPAPVAQYRW